MANRNQDRVMMLIDALTRIKTIIATDSGDNKEFTELIDAAQCLGFNKLYEELKKEPKLSKKNKKANTDISIKKHQLSALKHNHENGTNRTEKI
jgi:hypothetical protein